MSYLSNIAADGASSPMMVAAAAMLGLIGVALLMARRKLIAGTTLIAPWYWAVASLVSLSACEIVLGSTDLGRSVLWSDSLRFAAAVTTFCPVMAQLGAKRPQDRAWQLIVFSLWLVLAMPVAEAFIYQRGEQLNVRDARALFLWVLVAVGLLNILPTRFGFSAVLFSTGQLCLFSSHLPVVPVRLGAIGSLCGLGLFVLSLGMVVAGWPRSRVATYPEDRIWLDFRDMFGALSALRVADRLNAASELYGWTLVLRWNGFRDMPRDEPTKDESTHYISPIGNKSVGESQSSEDSENGGTPVSIPPDVRSVLHTSMGNLLRRFVTPEWIAVRLGQSHRKQP